MAEGKRRENPEMTEAVSLLTERLAMTVIEMTGTVGVGESDEFAQPVKQSSGCSYI